MKNKLRVAVAGGGTGGHYYPALAVLKHLEKNYDLEVVYFITKGRIEEKLLPVDMPNAKQVVVELKGLARPLYKPENIRRIMKVFSEKSRIKKILRDFKPDFGFLTGGYVCGPVGLAFKDLKIPFYLHEQNSVLGITNKRLSKNASKVFSSFEETLLNDKFLLTGNPVRTYSETLKRDYLKELGIKDINKRTVLVMFGSLGSDVLDEMMYNVYKKDNETNYIHITKSKEKFKEFSNVTTFDFLGDICKIFAVADGIVCRAGATTISEMKFYNLKGVLIPWRGAAEDHQYKNALSLKKIGLAEVLDESPESIDKIVNFIQTIPVKEKDFVWIPKDDESTLSILKNIKEIRK